MATLGERLRQEREVRGVSLEEISSATRINVKSLKALEDDEYDNIPAMVFITGFLRGYANHLGIDADNVVAEFQKLDLKKKPQRTPMAMETTSKGTTGSIVSIVIIVAALVGYVVYLNWPLINQTLNTKTKVPQTVAKAPKMPAQPEPKAMEAESPPSEITATVPETAEPAAATTTEKATTPSEPQPTTVTNETEEPESDTPEPQKQDATPKKKPAQTEETSQTVQRQQTTEVEEGSGASETSIKKKHRLVVSAGEKDVWILVVVDNDVVHDMFVRAGQRIVIRGDKNFNFTTGNAAHVKITIDGKDVPVPTPRSNVISRWMLPVPDDET